LPHIVWNNLQPLMDERDMDAIELLATSGALGNDATSRVMPRIMARVIGGSELKPNVVATLLDTLMDQRHGNAELVADFLFALGDKVRNREIRGEALIKLRAQIQPLLADVLKSGEPPPHYVASALLAAAWGDSRGVTLTRRFLTEPDAEPQLRSLALESLIVGGDDGLIEVVLPMLESTSVNGKELRRRIMSVLGRFENPQVGETVLAAYDKMEPELRPVAIELLTSRAAWAKQLLAAVKENRVPREAISVNQVRNLLASNDQDLVDQVVASWGALRTERSPERDQIIAQMRELIRNTPGDAHRGKEVFTKLCATCHKMYGEGQEVGPDITVNGRSSFEQLLSNVFDPSLVIGAAYQAVTVNTTDGRVLTGLLAENSDQRVVLKVQGGKTETIARADVDEMGVSKLSLMPEDVEKQLKPEEIADLFAYITLDRPPTDPNARQLPGVRLVEARESDDPAEFAAILAEVAPGFVTSASGEGGLALLSEHRGRATVVRTHPVGREEPCVLTSEAQLPSEKKSRLLLSVGCHDVGSDWQLIVRANGDTLLDTIIGPDTTENGWAELTIDLSAYAGKTVKLEVMNAATGWNNEWGYWGRAAVVAE